MLNMERKPEFHPRKRVEIISSILLEFSQTRLPASLPCWQARAGWTGNQKAKVDIIFSSAAAHFFTIRKIYFHANYILRSLLYTFLSRFFPNAEVSTYFYFSYVLFTYSVLSRAFPRSYRYPSPLVWWPFELQRRTGFPI